MTNRRNRIIIGVVAGIATVSVVGACSSSSESDQSADTVAAAETTAEAPADTTAETLAPDTTAAPSATAAPETTAAASTESTTELNIAGGNDPEDSLMPDVICMNLQEAQDEIQDHGVFFSRSVDASGQDRMQIMDSNWIVVDQTPAPGTKIGEGDAVLSVVKIGESTGGVC